MFARFMRGRAAFRRVVLTVALATAAYAAVVGFHVFGESASLWIDDLGLAVAAGAAGFAALFLSRRRSGRSRRAWLLISGASFLWAMGEIAWSLYELVLNREMPFPSWADAFYLGGTILAIIAVLFLGPPGEGHAVSLRKLLDGCILGGSLLLVSWIAVLDSVVRGATDGHFALGVSLAYPVGDAVMLAVVISVATHSRRRGRQAMMILAGGLALQAITDSLFVGLAAHNSYTGGFVDTGWFLGYLLVGVAALRELSVDEEAAEPSTRSGLGSVLLPYGAAVVSIGLRMTQEVLGHNGPFLFWCGASITVMVLGRLMLTITDNHTLARSLEHKVQERTAELGHRERLFRSLVQNSSDVMMVLDSEGAIASVSASASTILGLEPATLAGVPILELVHADDISTVQGVLSQAKSRRIGAFAIAEFRMRGGDGRWCQLETTIANLLEDPDVRGLVLNSRDIGERKALEAELTRQAFQDSLTGLANRALFRERIDHALARRDRLEQPLSVLFLDLDGFKGVNDTFGHDLGDDLLRQVGDRLQKCTRPGDTVARLGGDEFGILVETQDSSTTATALAERCITSIREPFELEDKQIFTDVSIGIAITNALENADEILRNADVAMYDVKSRGGGAYQLFDPRLHAALLRRVELARDLRGAVERGEFSVRFQPVYSLENERLEGAEALIRWEHPKRGEVLPDQFIPIAEQSGLIVPIGEWVLRHALTSIKRWSACDPPLTVAVNLSPRQLQEPDFPFRVSQILRETGADPARVILEITETALMQDTDEMIARLHALKRLGVKLAIDDFGTGYSSLNYLKQLPTDILKIDRAFISGVDSGPEDSALTRAIVRLSSTFGLQTVAEGIERPEQAEALKAMGCEFGQGFLFAHPLDEAAFERLTREPSRDLSPLVNTARTPGL